MYISQLLQHYFYKKDSYTFKPSKKRKYNKNIAQSEYNNLNKICRCKKI